MDNSKSKKNHLSTYFIGVLIGSVDIIPGISGGTIAFITGIYHDLIKNIDRFSLKELFRGEFKKIWSNINWGFLISLFLGIISGVLFLSSILVYLFEHHPIPIYSILFGIIVGIFFQFVGLIKNKRFVDYTYLLISLTFSIVLTQLNSLNVEPTLIYLFFCSVIAVSAMILPGISGAMIFLILGVYNEILIIIQNSINVLYNFNMEVFLSTYSKVFSISLGVILGLKIFSKFIVWLFKNKKRKTILILTGLVGGTLPKLWPMKNCLNLDTLTSLFTSNEDIKLCETHEINESVFFILVGLTIILIFNRLQKPIEYF